MIDSMKKYLPKIFRIKGVRDNRHEWVKSELSKIASGKTILDAGCGEQPYRKYCEHLIYKSQDFDKYDGKGSDKGLQCPNWQYGKLDYVGNIWHIDEKPESFDVILCTEVLEHVPYPNDTIKEFSRLLRTGGILLLAAPFFCVPHMQPYFYYTGFSEEYYHHTITENGFQIVTIESNGNAFDVLSWEINRSSQFFDNLLLRSIYTIFIRLTVIPIFNVLSKIDRKSNEVLTFGYHIKAIKI